MNIYVYDRGWAGASITVAKNKEDAKKILLDPIIKNIKEAKEKHDQLYFDPKSKFYDPKRRNPEQGRAEFMEENWGVYITEYPIKEGILIETDGE